jgi:hypothetical protein
MVVDAALPVAACLIAAAVVESRVSRTPPNQALHPAVVEAAPDGRG